MTPQWKADLLAREPQGDTPSPLFRTESCAAGERGDDASAERIALSVKGEDYRQAAIRWCQEAKLEATRADRWRKSAAWYGVALCVLAVAFAWVATR